MEFKYRDGQNQMVPATLPQALPPIISGFEFGARGFPSNVAVPSFVPAFVGTSSRETFQQELQKEQKILRELVKEEIRREIIISEMILARRKELEEEVRREMAEGIGKIPMQRLPRISFGEPISMPFNPTMTQFSDNNHDSFRKHHRQNNEKDNVIILAKPEAGNLCGKRKAVTLLTPAIIDGNKHGSSSLEKKAKQEWSCSLCKIFTTSEKGLRDHFQGRKHKSKEASSKIPKIGLVSGSHTQNTAATAANSACIKQTKYLL
ncbi:hypothetical protein ACSQ67_020861 [Phaseolus vulgaris]